MTTRTIVRSWPAMGLAGVFLAGTSFVLFNDIIFDGVKPTTGHVLTALALIAATAAGHLIVTTFRARRYFNGIGMVLLTAAALAYVATMSGARNAEQSSNKAERIEGSNAERERITKLREQAQAMLNAALRDVAAKCKGGVGKDCKGSTATRDVYEAAVKGHNADLAALPAQQTPNAGYKAAAEAIVMLPWFSDREQTDVEKALIVLLPWLAVLIAELGTIVFLSSALGHREVVTPADSRQTSFAGPVTAETTTLLASDKPDRDPPGGGKRGKRPHLPASVPTRRLPSNVVPISGKRAGDHPVISALTISGKPLSNIALAEAMRVCPGESTKRRQEVAHLLDERASGKFVLVGLKAWRQVSA